MTEHQGDPSQQQAPGARGRDGNLEDEQQVSGVPQQAAPTEITDDEKLWAMLAHIAYFILGIVGSVLILALHEDIIGYESEFVRYHAKQALFWQIGAVVIGTITCGLGFLVMAIWPILAALAASRKEWYDYPVVADLAKD